MKTIQRQQTINVLPEITEAPIIGLNAFNNGPTSFGNSTNLYATVDTGSDVAYEWEFGDGHKDEGASVHHMYAHPGEFMATVTARNAFSTMRATTFVIVDECDVWVTQPSNPQDGIEARIIDVEDVKIYARPR